MVQSPSSRAPIWPSFAKSGPKFVALRSRSSRAADSRSPFVDAMPRGDRSACPSARPPSNSNGATGGASRLQVAHERPPGAAGRTGLSAGVSLSRWCACGAVRRPAGKRAGLNAVRFRRKRRRLRGCGCACATERAAAAAARPLRNVSCCAGRRLLAASAGRREKQSADGPVRAGAWATRCDSHASVPAVSGASRGAARCRPRGRSDTLTALVGLRSRRGVRAQQAQMRACRADGRRLPGGTRGARSARARQRQRHSKCFCSKADHEGGRDPDELDFARGR